MHYFVFNSNQTPPRQPPPVPPKRITLKPSENPVASNANNSNININDSVNTNQTNASKTENGSTNNQNNTPINNNNENTLNNIEQNEQENGSYIKNGDSKSKLDHIKRKKNKENKRMTESEARKILSTMVTPGDPLDKYELKDKLGSG